MKTSIEQLIKTLRHAPEGHGHKKISVEIEGKWYDAITNNMPAFDAAFDDDYNNNPDVKAGNRFFESQREAQEILIDEILKKNNIQYLEYNGEGCVVI